MTAPITDEMLPAPTPPNEEARLAELNGLNLLDTPQEADFDQFTERLRGSSESLLPFLL